MLNDRFKLKGHLEIFEEGKLVYEKDNLIVNDGRELIFNLLSGGSSDTLGYIAIGSDITPALVTDTALLAELVRKAATVALVSATELKLSSTFNSGEAIGNWGEAGILTALVSGILFNRIVIGYTKSNVNVTVTFTISWG